MSSTYFHEVPNAADFVRARDAWRRELANDLNLREQGLKLYVSAHQHQYAYQWSWCGTPIIRVPEDIVLFQEIIYSLRPSAIVETGVARGGSVLLSAALMEMCGIRPRVLGIDAAIHPHTYSAILESRFSSAIELYQCDSAGSEARERVTDFIAQDNQSPAVLVLDSNHSHSHVLAELRALAPVFPVGSVVLVADTIIDEMPDGFYPDRPWGRGNSPASALRAFLAERRDFRMEEQWGRRGLMSEFRDGVVVRFE